MQKLSRYNNFADLHVHVYMYMCTCTCTCVGLIPGHFSSLVFHAQPSDQLDRGGEGDTEG